MSLIRLVQISTATALFLVLPAMAAGPAVSCAQLLSAETEYLDWSQARKILAPHLVGATPLTLTQAQKTELEIWAKHTLKTANDPLVTWRMLFAAITKAAEATESSAKIPDDPISHLMADALAREAEQSEATSDASKLYRAFRNLDPHFFSVLLDAAEERGYGLKFSVAVRIGAGFLSLSEVSSELKAQLILAQMGTPDWDRVRPLDMVPTSQKSEVRRLLYEQLPVMAVYEQMAKDSGIEDFPIDLAVAESMRMIRIPGTQHAFNETHMTNLLYAAGGLFPNEDKNPKTYLKAKKQILARPNSVIVYVNAEVDVPLYLEKWNRAAAKLGLKQRVRLPTENEHEVAQRAGTTTEFFWGEDEALASRYAVFGQFEYRPKMLRVGAHRGNAWGLKGMAGFAWHWTSTRNRGSDRVIRGGSWYDGTYSLRSDQRISFSPGDPSDYLGFRLVME